MARTGRKKSDAVVPGLQAPTGAWSPEVLHEAIATGTAADRRAALRAAGILDATGKLSDAYKNWGTKVTRTPDAEDVGA